MQWTAPAYGWLLLLLIPAVLIAIWSERRRNKDLQSFGGCARYPVGMSSKLQRLLHPACLAIAFLLIVIALCRPQWGEFTTQQESKGLDIMIVLDTSRSMLADDLQSNRLEAAKKAISVFSERLQGDRIGLIAFAGSAFMICPLTTDYDAFRQVLNETGPDTIPLGGSDLTTVPAEVRRGFTGSAADSRLLLVVSDGEDHGGNAATVARQLNESGVMICTVTAGSERGGIIPLPGGGFLKDRQGNIIHSRANPATLSLISQQNIRLESSGTSLKALYDQVRPQLLQSSVKNSRQRLAERFQLPLAGALLLLVLDTLLIGRRRP